LGEGEEFKLGGFGSASDHAAFARNLMHCRQSNRFEKRERGIEDGTEAAEGSVLGVEGLPQDGEWLRRLDRMKKWLWAIAWLVGLGRLGEVSSAEQMPLAFAGEVTLKVGYRYLLALPEGYQAGEVDGTKAWPLVVFLHGSGERGTDRELLKKHGPSKLLAEGQKFPAIMASLQCEAGQIWNPHGVKAVVDHLIQTQRVDEKRIYLTGLSLGGFGTWDTAMEYPETFAAIMPICGGAGVRWVMAERIKDLPCWIFHGDQDTAVPLEFSTKMHGALTKAGSGAKLTIYPGVGHDSWTQTYANPEVWAWLFAQRRP